MIALVGSPVRQVSADSPLMISPDKIQVIGNLVGVSRDVIGKCSGAKTEPASHGHLHAAFGVTESFDADVGSGKEFHSGPADYGSIYGCTEGIDGIGADQVRTAQRIGLSEIAIASIVLGLQRQKESVRQRVRVRRLVACHHVSSKDGVLVALLIIRFADNLILVGFLRNREDNLSAVILRLR